MSDKYYTKNKNSDWSSKKNNWMYVELIKEYKPLKIFIGKSLKCKMTSQVFQKTHGKKYDGNSILLQITNTTTNHQAYGSIMSKYLERMAKSNDQILKLAELIAKEEEKNWTCNDLYRRWGSRRINNRSLITINNI